MIEIIINDFKGGLAPGWQEKSFKGHTRYEVTRTTDSAFIKATSSAAASGLYYKTDYNPEQFPMISWSWKIENILSSGDAHHKQGDDYPARIYVVFPSFFFWQTKVLNYIWANKLPKGEAVPNPYTATAIMIAVESGPDRANKWQNASRNIYRDYIRYFGRKPGKVAAIAIMTDTDNTLKNSPLK